jgi:hypothetical protein
LTTFRQFDVKVDERLAIWRAATIAQTEEIAQ